jgi:hypothetical protein
LSIVDLECGITNASSQAKRTRRRTKSKAKAKREASSQAVVDTIKTFLADKEVSSGKRDERKRWEKEKAVKSYV